MSTPQISIAGSPAREHSDFNALNKSEFFTANVQTPPNTQNNFLFSFTYKKIKIYLST